MSERGSRPFYLASSRKTVDENHLPTDQRDRVLEVNWQTSEFGAAIFSQDRVYRYTLTRTWDRQRPFGVFIGLNPSTADEERLDPTLRRVMRFLDREGCGGMIVLNLFAYRATDPMAMKLVKEPVGEDNDHWIDQVVNHVTDDGPILVGWGTHGRHMNRSTVVGPKLPLSRTFHLGLCKDGEPTHPLYIASATPFVSWP